VQDSSFQGKAEESCCPLPLLKPARCCPLPAICTVHVDLPGRRLPARTTEPAKGMRPLMARDHQRPWNIHSFRYFGAALSPPPSHAGSVKLNVLPCPGSLTAQISPPMALTRPRQMYRPRPTPFLLSSVR